MNVNKNLHEMTSEYKSLLAYSEMFSEGEAPVELTKVIEEAEMERGEKIENTALLIKMLSNKAKEWKDEEDRIKKERVGYEKEVDKLKQWLGLNMGKETFKSTKVNVTGHLDVSVVYDVKPIDIPDEYKREKVTQEVDKPAITEALKNGEVLSFAHLVEKKRVK